MSCATPYACNPRTPKAHTSLWGTPTADNGVGLLVNLIHDEVVTKFESTTEQVKQKDRYKTCRKNQ